MALVLVGQAVVLGWVLGFVFVFVHVLVEESELPYAWMEWRNWGLFAITRPPLLLPMMCLSMMPAGLVYDWSYIWGKSSSQSHYCNCLSWGSSRQNVGPGNLYV